MQRNLSLMRIGDRVRLSARGLARLRIGSRVYTTKLRGTVVGTYAKGEEVIQILIDGRKHPGRFHLSYWQRLTRQPRRNGERGERSIDA